MAVNIVRVAALTALCRKVSNVAYHVCDVDLSGNIVCYSAFCCVATAPFTVQVTIDTNRGEGWVAVNGERKEAAFIDLAADEVRRK